MSGRTELTLEDSRGLAWRGCFRRDLDVLAQVFRHVVDINLDRLRRTSETIPEVWQAMMPATVRIERFLSPLAVHLSVMPAASVVSASSLGSLGSSGSSGSEAADDSSLPFESMTSDLSAGFVVRISPSSEPSASGWVSSFWRASPARRAYEVAHRIRAFGLAAPRPLGFLERVHSPARSLSFSAFEFVSGPSLYELRERLRALDDFRIKRAHIDRVAAAMRALHARGMSLGSFRLGQFLVPEPPGDDGHGHGHGDVVIVDLEAVRVRSLRRKAQVLMLAELERAFARPAGLTKTDRMRFLRTYLLHQGGSSRATRRQLWTLAAAEVQPSFLSERLQLAEGSRPVPIR
ncbi:MAG: hypothetical protein IPK13_06050 [Deltaproteobacteria bacterium]|nr:hypothetical protein [Deltaproteobacteria bacterium]